MYADFALTLGPDADLFGDFGPADAVPFASATGVSGVLLALRNKGDTQFGHDQLPMLAFDHAEILAAATAVCRLTP